MEKTSAKVESTDANASDTVAKATKQETISLDEALRQLAAKEATLNRVLAESKEHKSLARQMKEEKEAEAKARLEEQGKYKELYTSLEQKHQELKKNVVRTTVKQAVVKEAIKHNPTDLDDLFALGRTELLQYDESTSEVLGVDMFLDDLKKRKPYLFAQSKASINQINPGTSTQIDKKVDLKSLSKLPKAEQAKIWAQALNKK